MLYYSVPAKNWFSLSVMVCVFLWYTSVCVCVIHHGRLLVTQPAFPYRASSELVVRSSGRAETTSHTTHQDSETTTPRVTSLTYFLLCG